MANYIRNKFDLSVFDNLFFSNELGMRKPHLEIFEHVLKEIKTDANDSIFIDDKQENLDAAAQLGIKTILFQDAEQLISELKSLGIEI